VVVRRRRLLQVAVIRLRVVATLPVVAIRLRAAVATRRKVEVVIRLRAVVATRRKVAADNRGVGSKQLLCP
jgi:hypothetical protein